jgi:murein DD-endopeptidase MepM/ murein hydrolase activator NlpD
MIDSLRGHAWAYIRATFPERQLYIRSDGRVQFFTFAPLTQAIMAGITLLFLGWVAFTSVNTVFKDRIIASKEQNFRQMQNSYETRIADLQLSYDDLNGALVATEDQFRSVVDDIEAKHRTLASLVRGKEILRAEIGLDAAPEAAGLTVDLDTPDVNLEEEPDFTIPDSASVPVPGSRDAETPATGPLQDIRPTQEDTRDLRRGSVDPSQTFLEGAVRRLGSLFGNRPEPRRIDHPSLRQIAELESRLERLVPVQHTLMSGLQDEMTLDLDHFVEAVRTAGLSPETLLSRVQAEAGGVGGPEIVIAPGPRRSADPEFGRLTLETTETYGELSDIAAALRSVPMIGPVASDDFWQSSGFGARRDPFTNQLAFHGGIDFAAARGSSVQATAPGKIVFAGPRGAYGNTVEIDHGIGIKTRYGHLSRVLVEVGSEVERGDVVGTLGSTGRSTGLHVHYEVWFDDTVRNPSRFLRAGRYVHEEQRN